MCVPRVTFRESRVIYAQEQQRRGGVGWRRRGGEWKRAALAPQINQREVIARLALRVRLPTAKQGGQRTPATKQTR